MTGMKKIGEAILDKVKAEAKGIVKEAEGKAGQEIEQAKKQQIARLEEEKGRKPSITGHLNLLAVCESTICAGQSALNL